jgi:hypothetical protein
MASLLLQLLALAVGATTTQLGPWTLRGDRSNDAIAQAVARLVPAAQQELEARLGLAIQGRGTIVLCGSTASFRRATPGVDHRHTLGVAYPGRAAIYLNCELIESSPPENLAITLRHELSHLVVGEILRRGHGRVPLWFDEGVAVWSAGKVPRYDPQDFQRAATAGTLKPLAELAESFPLSPVARGIAYEQSESFIRFLVAEHGAQTVPTILQAAARGVPFKEAFEQAVGADVATVERQWLDSLRPRWRWLSWLVRSVSLFMLMSLLALFAFWVYWRRRRRKYEEWTMEEAFDGDHPSW